MKYLLLTTAATLANTSLALAQQPPSPVALSVGVLSAYRLPVGSGRLANYYALGSKINLVLHDTWFVGFTQLTSLSPDNLFTVSNLGTGPARLSEYAVQGGSKWHFAPKAYTLGSLQVGLGSLRQFGEAAAASRGSFGTVGVEAGIGYRLTRVLALEAGAGYHRYFRGRELPIATAELNSFSAGLSLVGTFGLAKTR